jgi:ribosomal protein S18 acetylase RimI-like enzyme
VAPTVASDEVDLAVARACVPGDDPDPARGKLARDPVFAPIAEQPAWIGHDRDVGVGLPLHGRLTDTAAVTVEIRAFTAADIDGAALVLADRHGRHRAVEPLLPAVEDFRAQVARELSADGASGAVSVRAGEIDGYVIGKPQQDPIGPHVRIDLAGSASRDPERMRDLYAAAARTWVDAGLTRHFAFVPALDDLVAPWHRLSFGTSAALAARTADPADLQDVRDVAPDVTVRLSTVADLHAAAALDRLLYLHLETAPSFSGVAVQDLDWFVDDWRTTWDDPKFTHFIAERGGQVVGHLLLYRRPAGDLRVPELSIDLADAATVPEVRGTGVGRALTAYGIRWARANGYRTITTDWRMTNLAASRFWPARGFRPTFYRLYRSIP